MRYDLTSLELFVTVAEEANLTRAARRAHLAVSAISKRMGELEAQVGTPLLQRHARGVSLTPAGQALLHYSRQVLRTLQGMTDELAEYAGGVKGHIRLHAVASALIQFLPEELDAFLRSYPQIRIDLEEHTGPAVVRAVAEGNADLGIIAARTAAPGLEIYPYREDRLVLVVPAGHPLARRRAVALADAAGYEFVGPHNESSLHALMAEAAAAAGVPLKQRVRVSSFDGMCRMIETRLGIGLLPADVVRRYASAMKVRAVRLTDAWAQRQMVICVREFEALPFAARALVDLLRAQALA